MRLCRRESKAFPHLPDLEGGAGQPFEQFLKCVTYRGKSYRAVLLVNGQNPVIVDEVLSRFGQGVVARSLWFGSLLCSSNTSWTYVTPRVIGATVAIPLRVTTIAPS